MGKPFRWPAIDGLRAVAVSLVMIGHYAHVTEIGSLGVETFYVISGFLITWLLVSEYEGTGSIRPGTFYLRRSFRIFPAFYVFLFINALVLAGTPAMPRPGFWAAAATYTADYYAATHVEPSGALTHTWSLAVEEQFYLLWPLLLAFLLRKGRRTAGLAVLGVMVAVTVWRVGLVRLVGVPSHYLQFAPDARADFLAVGALVALGWGMPSYQAFATRLDQKRWLLLLTVAALVAVAATLGRARAFELSYPVKVVLLGLLLAQLVGPKGRGTWRLLDRPLMRWLGAISYSLYLYHYLIWVVVGWTISDPMVRGVLGAALTLPVAALSYYGVERPFLRLRERIRPAPVSPERPARFAEMRLGSAPA
jgi:peptidoglycan/LPS O-acetylase OafA/YrhL